jgi:NADPH-dependent curcumin reductase CurA
MFRNVTRHGKIGVCGAISVYNGAKADLSSFTQVISNRIQIEGEDTTNESAQYLL